MARFAQWAILALLVVGSLFSCQAPFMVSGSGSELTLRFSATPDLARSVGTAADSSARLLLPEMAGQKVWITLTRKDSGKELYNNGVTLTVDTDGWLVASVNLQVPKGILMTLRAEIRNGGGTAIARVVQDVETNTLASNLDLSLIPTADMPLDATLQPGTPFAGVLNIANGTSKVLALDIGAGQAGKGNLCVWTKDTTGKISWQIQGEDGVILPTVTLASSGGFLFNPPAPGRYWVTVYNPAIPGEGSTTEDLIQPGLNTRAAWLLSRGSYLKGWSRSPILTQPDFDLDSNLGLPSTPAIIYPVYEQLPTNSLQGRWDLDGDATASTGSNLAGSWSGVADRYGRAGSAQSSSSPLSSTDPAVLFSYTEPFTLSGWFRFDNDASGHPFWSHGGSVVNYGLYFAGGSLNAQFTYNGGTGTGCSYTLLASDYTKWMHVAYVYDATKKVSLYINGVFKAISPTAYSGAGAKPNDFSFNFPQGAYDDLRIYNTVLTPAEISNLAKE